MKRLILQVGLCSSLLLHADPNPFSRSYLETFYNDFTCEEKNTLFDAGVTSRCIATPPTPPVPPPIPPIPVPPAPTPPPNPAAPNFDHSGYLPFSIVNNSGVSSDDVFVIVQGKNMAGDLSFVQFTTGGVGVGGVGTLIPISLGDNGMNYARALSSFPPTPGNTGFEFYLPYINGGLVYFSLNKKLSMPIADDGGVLGIVQPPFNNPADPNGNFTTIWDQMEVAFVNTGTNVNVDATAVSFFSIPLAIFLSTPDPGSASTCGLTQSRSTILSYIKSSFASVPQPAASKTQWQNLILGSGSTTYRVISPGKGIAGGQFDQNYLDNAAAYGYSYIADIWSGPSSFYRRNPSSLSIEIPGGKIYTGNVQPDNSIFFTSSGGDTVTFAPPVFSPTKSTTSFLIFSGLPLVSSATNPADGIQVSKAFEEAIIAGIVPTTSLINASTNNTLSVFRPYYQINPNLTGSGPGTGPWYDLYSASLHACGLIYTYAFDEPLWPEVLLASQTLINGSTYVGITIGNTQ